jgi:hypothetical protein
MPLVLCEVGSVYRALSAIVVEKLSPSEILELEANVTMNGGIFLFVGGNARTRVYQRLEFLDDNDRLHLLVCAATGTQRGESIVLNRWRQSSAPAGGQRVDPNGNLGVVSVDNSTGEHRFVPHLLKHCSKKLCSCDAAEAAILVSGLNDSGIVLAYLPEPDQLDPIRRIVPGVKESILVSTTRSILQVAVPTKEQHGVIRGLLGDGNSRNPEVRIHHQLKNGVATNYSELTRNSARTAEQATDCLRDGLLHKLKPEGYGVCTSGASVRRFTPIQKRIAAVIFQSTDAQASVDYLRHRLGTAKIDELQKLARTLQDDKIKILKRLGPSSSAS